MAWRRNQSMLSVYKDQVDWFCLVSHALVICTTSHETLSDKPGMIQGIDCIKAVPHGEQPAQM
jgi:hypothetical protein